MRFVTFLLVLLIFEASVAQLNRVAIISVEKKGVLQTGGLADATVGAAEALNEVGITTDFIMPFFHEMNRPADLIRMESPIDVPLDFRDGQAHRHSRFWVWADPNRIAERGHTYFFRHDNPGDELNYFDNSPSRPDTSVYGPNYRIGEAFGAWAKGTAEFVIRQGYDLVIVNDWHTALVSLFIHLHKESNPEVDVPRVVMAIHNQAYQGGDGGFPRSLMNDLGIPDRYFDLRDGIEFHGKVNFQKAGILFSDMIYAVSPTYAHELTTERHGAGLDGLMRRMMYEMKLTGIMNGINEDEWTPRVDHGGDLKFTFTDVDQSGKRAGKTDLQNEMGLAVDASKPLYVMSSRLAEQKGYEYLIDAIDASLRSTEAQFIVIGNGDSRYATALKALENRVPGRFQYRAFSNSLEKRLLAYGDFFINAAWFEPCGLNQFFAKMSGTLPILSRVGGLATSIQHGVDGFHFGIQWRVGDQGYDREAMIRVVSDSIQMTARYYKTYPQEIERMRVAAMRDGNSWIDRVKTELIPLLQFVVFNGPERLRNELPHDHPDRRRLLTPRELRDRALGIREQSCSALF